MSAELETYLSAEEIDCSGSWLVWSKQPEEGFLNSIRKWGQLQAVLISSSKQSWQLISGYKRFMACRELNRQVLAKEIKADDVAKACLYLQENAYRITKTIDFLPWARFIQSIQENYKDLVWTELSTYIPSKELNLILTWLELPSSWDDHLLENRLTLDLAPLLAGLNSFDLQALKPFFSCLRWSKNKAKNLISHLFESAKRDQNTIAQIISDHRLDSILSQNLSPKDCQQKILQLTKEIRFPALSSLEKGFLELQKKVRQRTIWRIEPEQHFETNGFYLIALVRKKDDLLRSVDQLQGLLENGFFDQVWDWQDRNLK